MSNTNPSKSTGSEPGLASLSQQDLDRIAGEAVAAAKTAATAAAAEEVAKRMGDVEITAAKAAATAAAAASAEAIARQQKANKLKEYGTIAGISLGTFALGTMGMFGYDKFRNRNNPGNRHQ
jgi:hypothetical protein